MLEKYHSLLSQLFAGCAFVSTEEKKKEGRQARNLKKKKKNWSNKEFLILEAKFWFKINLKHSSYAFFW